MSPVIPKSPNTSWFLAERECLFRRVKYLQALSCQIWELKWCLRCKSAGISLILLFHIIFMNYAHKSLLFIRHLHHRSLKLQIKTFFHSPSVWSFLGNSKWCLYDVSQRQLSGVWIREKSLQGNDILFVLFLCMYNGLCPNAISLNLF